RFHGAIVFTQAQNDRLLLIIDHVNGVEQPEHEHQNPADDPDSTGNTLSTTDTPGIAAGAPALLLAENADQPVLLLAHALFEVRPPLIAAAVVTAATVTAAPGILVVRIVTATRLIPRHSVLRCQKPCNRSDRPAGRHNHSRILQQIPAASRTAASIHYCKVCCSRKASGCQPSRLTRRLKSARGRRRSSCCRPSSATRSAVTAPAA